MSISRNPRAGEVARLPTARSDSAVAAELRQSVAPYLALAASAVELARAEAAGRGAGGVVDERLAAAEHLSREAEAGLRRVLATLDGDDPRPGPEAWVRELPVCPVDARGPLTEREAEVLQLLARGMSNRAIGRRLFISETTAKFHVGNILRKLGVSRRAEAVYEASKSGLL